MEKFVIEGGVPLSGTIVPAGNKNGALPVLAACLLTEDQMVLRNVPRIADVEAMLMLLETLGAGVEWLSDSEVSIRAGGVDRFEVDRALAERLR
ncbi:MAG: UDP-N-acetylglucosamine 1-carboxyvinyltransferase, partial [Solirubrobacterales bacterium]|nr:UDP-N-acetylglucosamine 1-carboxyvinyltransferase [Solirubrobacterales bacterium]